MNSRMTKKERGLLKGAIRRVFSRSDLRRQIIDTCSVEHSDSSRPRVKKWGVCAICKYIVPRYEMHVDHKDPIIPVDSTLDNMSWDVVIDRTWCKEQGLQAVCKPCHTVKTKAENKQRRRKVK